MENVLIIGGCGHIGSALYSKLIGCGLSVKSVDLEWFGNPGIENIRVDYKHLNELFLGQFGIIVLLAGHSSAKMCENNPISTHYNNVVNFINLLGKLNNQQKLIYASSSSVYGNASGNVDENYNNYEPINYYDLSKKQIDLYAQLSKVEYYGLRFGTACGSSPNLRNDIMLNAMYDKFVQTGKILLFNECVYRPILGMNDLVNAISTIIDNKCDNRGLYNLASFNMQAGEIAQRMGSLLGCGVEKITDNSVIINTKLQSTSYNFSISPDKFKKTFAFEFNDTVESILNDLRTNYQNSIIRNGRSKIFQYTH